MEIESIILNAAVTIFSLGMFLVSVLSYRKYRNIKLFFVSIAFFVFFIKGVLQSLGLFYEEIAQIRSSVYLEVFDLIILILLFSATLKR